MRLRRGIAPQRPFYHVRKTGLSGIPGVLDGCHQGQPILIAGLTGEAAHRIGGIFAWRFTQQARDVPHASEKRQILHRDQILHCKRLVLQIAQHVAEKHGFCLLNERRPGCAEIDPVNIGAAREDRDILGESASLYGVGEVS